MLLGNEDAGVSGQATAVPKVITPGTVESFSTTDKQRLPLAMAGIVSPNFQRAV